MSPAPGDPESADVLVATVDRVPSLVASLTGIAAQDRVARVVLADQSDEPSWRDPAVAGLVRLLRHRGTGVELHHRPERRGVAEQLDFLLSRSRSPLSLALGDDVVLEPGAVATMATALRELRAGFVGMAVTGLGHVADERPADWTAFEIWDGPVQPERVRKGTREWDRWRLHNAANMVHLAQRVEIPERGWLAYKVAWVGGCTMYDTRLLREVGGFSFWPALGRWGYGEDVVVQLRLLEAAGGAGLLPSLAHHLQLPTTLPRREVDGYEEVIARSDAAAPFTAGAA